VHAGSFWRPSISDETSLSGILMEERYRLSRMEEALPLPGKTVFRHIFVPLILVLSVLPWFHHRESGKLFVANGGESAVAPSMLLLCMLLVWVGEQLYPARPEWNPRLISDGLDALWQLARTFFYLFGVTRVTGLLIAGADAWLKPTVATLPMVARELWPHAAPFTIRVALAFLILEFASYWIHRATHRFRPLWQFHSTHHVMTEINGLKALQTHPIDNLLFYVCRAVPLMCLGAGFDEVTAALYFGGILGVLAHANIVVSERYWGLVFNLPGTHSLHHSADLAESGSNFGCHTVLWDRIFGTYRTKPGGPLSVGVDPVGRRSLWQELIWPFYRSVG
jgi:sterol desaturase/sphingolipid hydroxylase (fatty acid hydroxylase superfamily)